MNGACSNPMLAEAERLIAKGQHKMAHELCLRALGEKPNDSEALFVLGVIANENGAYAKAAELFEKASVGQAHNARLHAQNARALAFLQRPEDARAAAERASAAAPDDALTLDTIGVVLSRAGMHEQALTFFANAAARAPDVAAFQLNHAASLQFSGQFKEAEAAYRRAYMLDPKLDRALSAIPHLRKQTRDDNLISELRAAFSAAGDHLERRLHLGHALAKSLEDVGEYQEALLVLHDAKRAGARFLAPAEQRDRAVFAAAAQTTGSWRKAGYDSEEPVFIVGLPRTGTTLTDRILSSHAEVFSAGELGAFALIIKRMTATASRFVLDAEALNKAVSLDPAEIGKAYLDATRPRTGHTARFVDKMPLNFFYAGLIHRALPRARIICLRRNPMDSCLSNYRQLLGVGGSSYDYTFDLASTARYYAAFDRLTSHWRHSLPPTQFTEIWYEDLVRDLEANARRLVEFVGLPWDARCLDFHENAAPVATASSVQVRSPLYTSSLDRWRLYGEALAPLRAALQAEGIAIDD
ncbi:tetratricopeptide repeat-containing sulfotransferase family protein [Vitreimonas sp.]|uniref:tetratricopeptide repeat-containing sulfotransferase family protein n=1 Tax=Vitreimonas sp. TaxID=3069702 RepID=UPI002ED87233